MRHKTEKWEKYYDKVFALKSKIILQYKQLKKGCTNSLRRDENPVTSER